MMRVIKFELDVEIDSDGSCLDDASSVILTGGIIAYPTDTTYALGVNALDPLAINKLYSLKGRNFNKPLHVVVSDMTMANEFVWVDENARVIADKFLPGPLTLILPKRDTVPDVLVGSIKTLGIRIPSNLFCLNLAKKLKIPFTTTSANISGGKNSYSVNEIIKQFGLKVNDLDLIIDQGTLPEVLPSTLVDMTKSPPEILREGPISRVEILEALKLSSI